MLTRLITLFYLLGTRKPFLTDNPLTLQVFQHPLSKCLCTSISDTSIIISPLSSPSIARAVVGVSEALT